MTAHTTTMTGQGWFKNGLPISLDESQSLLRLALPMTAAALANMGMSVTDVVMMGYFGPHEVAAGAIVSDLYSIVYYFCAGVIAALSPEIARAVSGRRRHAVRQATQLGLWVAFLSAFFAFCVLWHTDFILSIAGVDDTIIALGTGYAKMMALTSISMMGVALWRNVYGALGHPRVFLIATLIALPMNALADYLLMFGGLGLPAMGLTGAGLASALIAAGMAIGLALNSGINGSIRHYHLLSRLRFPDWRRFGEVLRIGIPIGISGFGEVGVFLISTLLAGLFGAEALAAHAITLRLAGVVYAIPLGLSQAATVRIGYAIGAHDNDSLRSAAWTASAIALIAGGVICSAFFAGREVLPWIFLQSSEAAAGSVAQLASTLLILLGVIEVTQGPGTVFAGILRGFKDTRIPMVIILISFWGVGMATISLAAFSFGFDVIGIWSGIALGGAVMTAALAHRLKKQVEVLP